MCTQHSKLYFNILHIIAMASGFRGGVIFDNNIQKIKISASINIRKTCPCNVYPIEPHFYKAKMGYAVVFLFFLFLLQNIDCGYSLEPPRREKYHKFSIESVHFLQLKNLCILHGQVFVMNLNTCQYNILDIRGCIKRK